MTWSALLPRAWVLPSRTDKLIEWSLKHSFDTTCNYEVPVPKKLGIISDLESLKVG